MNGRDHLRKTPTLEHRHFVFIADVIRACPDDTTREQVAQLFATRLRATNHRFSTDRFLDACHA